MAVLCQEYMLFVCLPFSQGRPVPCRAQIWWIRAVPNISVPCPDDPVPCQIVPCRALMIRAQIWWIRAQKYGSPFCGKKRRLRQRTHKFRASRNMGPFFVEKKSACGNVPTSSGLPEICPPLDSGRKTRFSNGLAHNRSKVSVKNSEIGFVVINFSRSIFPYM